MNKTIKITLLISVILSFLSGVFIYLYKEKTDAFYGIFIGIVLIGSLFLSKTKREKDDPKK